MNRKQRLAARKRRRSRLARLPRRGEGSAGAAVIAEGDRLAAAGRFDAAVTCFERAPEDAVTLGKLAYALAAGGRVPEAVTRYEEALALAPDNPALHANLGILLQATGRLEDARERIARALELDPDHANALYHMGDILTRLGRDDEARAFYRRAVVRYRARLAGRPGDVDDHVKLGNAHFALAMVDHALACYRHALARAPDHAVARSRMGLALTRAGRYEDAILCFRRVLATAPDDIEARRTLAQLLRELGRFEPAARVFRKVLRQRPDDQTARYFLAAIDGGAAPEVPPEGYVESLFDGYADIFDAHLVDVLGYRAPWLLRDAVEREVGSGAGVWKVMDLGCGTGLCGPLFRAYAKRLIGVDKSPRMIEKARERGVYDDLQAGDLGDALAAFPDGIDLVIAADVFVYIGNLAPVFAAASRAVKAGGWLAFTTEIAETGTFTLDVSGRFGHSDRYIRALSTEYGFSRARHDEIVVRRQSDDPVSGALYVMRRDDDQPWGGRS